MKVRIYKPHTHAGVSHVPDRGGIEIDVTAPDAEFLRANGLLDPPGCDLDRAKRPARIQSNASPEVASGNDPAKTPAETKRTST